MYVLQVHGTLEGGLNQLMSQTPSQEGEQEGIGDLLGRGATEQMQWHHQPMSHIASTITPITQGPCESPSERERAEKKKKRDVQEMEI